MSKIYLPDGGKIEIHVSWTSEIHDVSGVVTLYNTESPRKFLGYIMPNGTCHLSNLCSHTYYPPSVNNFDHCFDIVLKDIKKVSNWRIRDLKKLLEDFNAKTMLWKYKIN